MTNKRLLTVSCLYQKYLGRAKLFEIEVVLFGFALVLGNRFFFWNRALEYGYESLAANTLIVGSTFFCLCLCMGEMTSALPFSGGIFGFVRAATGPYYGFIVACLEVIFCFSYVIGVHQYYTIIPLAAGFIDISDMPNLIGIFYGFNLFLNLLGGKSYWIIVCLAGFATFFLLLSFLFGTLIDMNTESVSFVDNCRTTKHASFAAIMEERPFAVAQFQGLHYLPLLSEFSRDPRKTIPRAMMTCATSFIVFSIFVSLAACSTFPGQKLLQMVPTPLKIKVVNSIEVLKNALNEMLIVIQT